MDLYFGDGVLLLLSLLVLFRVVLRCIATSGWEMGHGYELLFVMIPGTIQR